MDAVAKIRAAKELSEALGSAVLHFAADTGTLHLLEADGMLHLKALSGQFPSPVLAIIQKIPVGKGMAGLAVERAETLTPAVYRPTRVATCDPGAKATGMEGAIVAPVFDGARVVGALGIANRGERSFDDQEIVEAQ